MFIYSFIYIFQVPYHARATSLQAPDLEDVKDSVRQGVSKVAGRLSNVASGVMTQLQVKQVTQLLSG